MQLDEKMVENSGGRMDVATVEKLAEQLVFY